MSEDLTPLERAGLPDFLKYRDLSWREERELRRDQYALRGREDRPFTVNHGFGWHPFTVEDALAWAERRADEVLK